MALSGTWYKVVPHAGWTKMISWENTLTGKAVEQEVKTMPMERVTAREPMELDFRDDTFGDGHCMLSFEKSEDGETISAQGFGAKVGTSFVGVAQGDMIIVSDETQDNGEARYQVTSPVENYADVYDMWRAELTRMPG